MTPDEESGFSFVDKRRVDPSAESGEEKATPTPPETAESPESTGPVHDGTPAGLPRLSVQDRLLMSIDILHQGAWIAMGLVADPGSGEIERNMEDAKIAIDCVAVLADKVEASLDAASRSELKRMVSDLQVNYVRQMQK